MKKGSLTEVVRKEMLFFSNTLIISTNTSLKSVSAGHCVPSGVRGISVAGWGRWERARRPLCEQSSSHSHIQEGSMRLRARARFGD
jgi:hypothetical protein